MCKLVFSIAIPYDIPLVALLNMALSLLLHSFVYIDEIERLGLAYHFEAKIEIILREFHENYNCKNGLYEDNLYYVSIRFRLLRQHGFYASSGKILSKLPYNVALNLDPLSQPNTLHVLVRYGDVCKQRLM